MGGSENQDLVIVGNGMTGYAFCQFLTERGRDTLPFSSITVFGDEPRPAYDRVNLSDCFDGKTPADLELAPREWYEQNGIELRTGVRVNGLDRNRRKVTTTDGEEFGYDKLVLATGSRPFVPPVPGVELDGVFVYRTIEDIDGIREWGQRSKQAAVLGGGLLGLEAAKALRDMGLIVHVVEMAPGLMPRQLDRESGRELQHRIERLGVRVHLTRRTSAIERHGEYLVVQFDSGDSLAVDMVVISAGIRPRDELAGEADEAGEAIESGETKSAETELVVGSRGGFVVDDGMATSDPSIFAIGECAEHRGTVYGLVGPCYQMAKVLANRFHGDSVQFEGGDKSAKLKLLGVDVCTFGEPIGEASGATIVDADTSEGSRKLLMRGGRMVGALGVGPWPEAERIRAAVATNRRPWSWQLRRFRKTGSLYTEAMTDDVSQWPPDATICSCLQIKRSDLTSACQTGCSSVKELADATGASTVCGSCKPLLAQMVGKAGQVVEAVAGWRGLLAASVAVIGFLIAMKISGPIEFSESVVTPRRQLDFLWRDELAKQVSGYVLLAITVLSLMFSMRKRIHRINWGKFGTWRMAHGILGAVTLVGVLAHTGFHWGANLNFWLMSCFIGLNLLGAFTGVVTSLESRVSGGAALMLRQWRPRLTLVHIFLFWPLPLLIAAHIFSIYYY